MQVQNNKRSIEKKRVSNLDNDEDNNNNDVIHRQSPSSYCSEDESNASHELNGGLASSSNSKGSGKARASRGLASDPQSLYARKRRERINERLRILQNLVPDGAKVDINTMLEEAVQYVKFLQIRIKAPMTSPRGVVDAASSSISNVIMEMESACPRSCGLESEEGFGFHDLGI
ncbi:transcription factor bHLH84-like [Olea europaea subsp. europaea]|uniref:Transcription factor bHLH84-like n=1 Tax=Olea europaea subsp. europaea TaxID=158383 RepID=A0A8S0T5W7_OLEEU|nr:transcription factor bHLH84-like [Olea europaea subsp. europaea]